MELSGCGLKPADLSVQFFPEGMKNPARQGTMMLTRAHHLINDLKKIDKKHVRRALPHPISAPCDVACTWRLPRLRPNG